MCADAVPIAVSRFHLPSSLLPRPSSFSPRSVAILNYGNATFCAISQSVAESEGAPITEISRCAS
eukprot:163804-Pyramimonas_sp.AAC.1